MEDLQRLSRVEEFLGGLMPPKEKEAFERELTGNMQLQKQLRLSKAIEAAIADEPAMRFEAALQKAQTAYTWRERRTLIYKVAASLVFLVAIGGSILFYMSTRPSDMVKVMSKHYEVYQPLNGLRSADPGQGGLLREAFDAYAEGDYAQSARYFGQISGANPTNIQSRFFQAMSLMQINKDAEAEAMFKAIINSEDRLYTALADYYLGMCYLKAGNKDLAISQFSKIAGKEGGYQAKARTILEDLKAIK